MKRKINTEIFIQLSKKKYKDLFEYDKTEYINWTTQVTLKCKKCGKYFSITPAKHLGKLKKEPKYGVVGCPECNYKNGFLLKKEKDKEQFFKKAINIHGNNSFDYFESDYVDMNTPIKIKCLKCNNYFWQAPINHLKLSHHYCPNCIYSELGNNRSIGQEEFIKRCYKIHGNNRYDLSKVKYTNLETYIRIIDKINNVDFLILPQNFLDGLTYETKGRSSGEVMINSWVFDKNIKYNREVSISIFKYNVRIDYITYYNNKQFWIEYNGKQHYDPDSMIKIIGGDSNNGKIRKQEESKTHARYIRQVERDKVVRKYCEENNIVFIEIPYTYNTYPAICKILDRIILNGENPDNVIKKVIPKSI